MGSALEFIQVRAPLFAGLSNIEGLISQAEIETTTEFPSSDLRAKAVGLLACHWAALAQRDSSGDGVSGNVIMEREGRVERRYSQGFHSTDLSRTSWGMELEAFINKYLFCPGTWV